MFIFNKDEKLRSNLTYGRLLGLSFQCLRETDQLHPKLVLTFNHVYCPNLIMMRRVGSDIRPNRSMLQNEVKIQLDQNLLLNL